MTYIHWKPMFIMGEVEDMLNFLEIMSLKENDTSKHV